MLIFYCIVNTHNLLHVRIKLEVKEENDAKQKRKVKNKNISYNEKFLAGAQYASSTSLYTIYMYNVYVYYFVTTIKAIINFIPL